jgi:hypothetical protein
MIGAAEKIRLWTLTQTTYLELMLEIWAVQTGLSFCATVVA